MNTTNRDNIASRVALLLGLFSVSGRPSPEQMSEAADAGASLLADVLTDVNRIADAMEKLTTFDFKRIGDVAFGGFPDADDSLAKHVQKIATEAAIRNDEYRSGFNPGPEGGTAPGSAEDFAAYLTTLPEPITVGATNTVYAVFDAVKKYRERVDNGERGA